MSPDYTPDAAKRARIARRPQNDWLERDRHQLEAKADDAPRPMKITQKRAFAGTK